MNNQSRFLHSLNALRGTIAISVCLYHSSAAFGDFGAFAKGYLGVDLFFLLSGFIGFYRFDDSQEPIFVKQVSKRFVRIYPTYIIATLIGAMLLLSKYFYRGFPIMLDGELSPYFLSFIKTLSLNILFLPDFDSKNLVLQAPLFPFSLQNWTLFWELLVAICFIAWLKIGARFGMAIGVVFIALYIFLFSNSDGLNQGYDANGFWMGGLRAFCGFSLGVMVARVFKSDLAQKLRGVSNFAIPIMMISILYYSLRGDFGVWFDLFFSLIMHPILVFSVAGSNSRVLGSPILQFLGRISFAIFGLHIVILSLMFFVYSNFGLFELNLSSGLVYLAIVIVSATLFERFIETPLQTSFKRKQI